MPRINPFKPNSPVSPGMFAGRISEILAIEKSFHQTKNGYPSHLLITGERGIGKSSLIEYVTHVSNGRISSFEHGDFNFVTINLSISEKIDLVTLIQLFERHIKRELCKVEKVRSFLDSTWEFVQRLKIMDSGIEGKTVTQNPDLIMDDFSYSLAETCKRIIAKDNTEDRKDGLVFFIDEADNASADLQIGCFIKTLTENLLRNGCNNVMLVLAGLPEINDKLVTSHPSSIRIFSELKIRELNTQDRLYVIDRGIEEGNKINLEKTLISQSAKSHICSLSEGYPHFIQQFAFSAFEHNSDGEISDDDVLEGAFKERGALDAIGRRYYASNYFEQIKSDEYRQVLGIMSEKMNNWVSKKEISEKFTGSIQTLNNALQALTTRKIILRNPSARGEYRLQQKGFALWIKLFGDRIK